MNTQPSVPAFITHANLKRKKYIHLCIEICVWSHFKVGNYFCSFNQVDWWNLMKQSVTVDAQLLWSGRYGCNNGRYGCPIVMSYSEINKAVSQWMLTFNLCVSVTWPLTCAFHIPCTHTPEIIDMHRGMCDNILSIVCKSHIEEGRGNVSNPFFVQKVHGQEHPWMWICAETVSHISIISGQVSIYFNKILPIHIINKYHFLRYETYRSTHVEWIRPSSNTIQGASGWSQYS